MDVEIYVKEMVTGEGVAKNVYQVDYIVKHGDGYSCCNMWKTFGVYESLAVAEFVRDGIEKGSIQV